MLSAVLSAANAYLGLFAGLTVSASIPAAVISMAVLRVLGGNILENNIVQTSASAGEAVAAGVIFTIPGLVILGTWGTFDYLETTMIAAFGGVLGVLFTIPLRRALIVETPLEFPEGVATAEVLKVGESGGGGIAYIFVSGAIGALFKLGEGGPTIVARHDRRGALRRRNDRVLRLQPVPRAHGGGLHRRPRHRGARVHRWRAQLVGRDPDRRVDRRRARGRLGREGRGRHLVRQDAVPRRRRDGGRRPVGARSACASRSSLASARVSRPTAACVADRMATFHAPSRTCRCSGSAWRSCCHWYRSR